MVPSSRFERAHPGLPARAFFAPVFALVFAPLLLLMAACTGSTGELGEEHFVYRCAGSADSYCDAVLYDSYCTGTCERPFDGNLDEEVPGSIALGSRFLVLADPSGFSAITPRSVSPSVVDWDGEAFLAVATGEVALLAFQGAIAQDFIYITVVEPADLRVDFIDAEGVKTPDVRAVTLATGEEFWLRAVSLDDQDQTLHGALPCAWSTGDGTHLELLTDPGDNLVRFTADATETVTLPLQVYLGALEATVDITVLDASSLPGGAP